MTASNLSVISGQIINYTVGNGGAGVPVGNCTNGVAGGNSNVTVSAINYLAGGGDGGHSCNDGTPVMGGVATGGSLNQSGGAGIVHAGNTGGAGGAGAGGGGGGIGGPSGANGTGGSSPGGGGGGGGKQGNGGNGAAGQVTITW